MRRIVALLMVLALLCPLSVGAQDLKLDFEEVEEDLIRQEETRRIMEASAPEKEGGRGGTWLYVLGGVVLLGAAAGGGGGGGGGGTGTDTGVIVGW